MPTGLHVPIQNSNRPLGRWREGTGRVEGGRGGGPLAIVYHESGIRFAEPNTVELKTS